MAPTTIAICVANSARIEGRYCVTVTSRENFRTFVNFSPMLVHLLEPLILFSSNKAQKRNLS